MPYAYGFAIILLTVLVKATTFPLTRKQVCLCWNVLYLCCRPENDQYEPCSFDPLKFRLWNDNNCFWDLIVIFLPYVIFITIPLDKILSDCSQVESAMAMRSLQPQVKAIQQRYAGDQVLCMAFISVTFSNKIYFVTWLRAIPFSDLLRYYLATLTMRTWRMLATHSPTLSLLHSLKLGEIHVGPIFKVAVPTWISHYPPIIKLKWVFKRVFCYHFSWKHYFLS